MALALSQAELDLDSTSFEIKPETWKRISFLISGLSELEDFILVKK